MPASSQGAYVTFDGVPIGNLTGFQASPSSAVFAEKTNVTSQVVGGGDNSRIVKEYDCVAIEPGSIRVSLYGCPASSPTDTGHRATLVLSSDAISISQDAYLETYDVTGAVGQYLVGNATFRLA
jgi:hypothetical protein